MCQETCDVKKPMPVEKSLFPEERQKSISYHSRHKITRLIKLFSGVWIQEKGTQVCSVTWCNKGRIQVHATPFGLTQGSAQINIKLLTVRLCFPWKFLSNLGAPQFTSFAFATFSLLSEKSTEGRILEKFLTCQSTFLKTFLLKNAEEIAAFRMHFSKQS